MTDFIYKYRWVIILFFMTTGILAVLVIPHIKVDPDMRNYIPRSMRSSLETDSIEKVFGVQDMIMVLFSDTNILSKDNLLKIKDIDRSISRINGISNRMSLFTVRSIDNKDRAMTVDPLIGEIPDDTAQLRQLGRHILENRFARNVVISSDLTTAAISAAVNSDEEEAGTLNRVDSVITSHPGSFRVQKGGLPYIRQSITNDVTSDALLLIPFALIIMLLVLKLSLGKWQSVMMPFSIVILSMAISVALIPLFGWNMSIITILVPVILISVANNYGIYLTARLQELRSLNPEASIHDLIRALLRSLNMPILFSGLTTIAGIMGLLTHSIVSARQVGILAAAGVSLALVLSLLLIPAMIFATGAGSINGNTGNNRKRKSTISFSLIFDRLSAVVIRYPGRIILISGIVVLIFSSGIFLLRINTNQETYFSSMHPVRRASEIINSKFGGSQTISVMIDGDIKDPEVMEGIDRLTSGIEKEEGVGNVFSISLVVREMSKAIYTNNEDGYNKIPVTREAIAQMFELYFMSGDQSDFIQLIDPGNTKAQVLISLADPQNITINRIKARISDLTVNMPAKVTVGGYAVIMADFARLIIMGQIYSLSLAVIAIFVLLALIFKSVKGGLIGSIPLVASVIILFGFMGFAGIAIDAATALISSIMIGVGVDFTIQYIWCFKQQIRSGMSYREATETAHKTIGRSIIINALSVMAGFSSLVFSGFLSIRFFGYLVIVSIGSCLLGAIVVIPAILVRFSPRFVRFSTINNKYLKDEVQNNITGITSAAFAGSSATSRSF